MSENEQSTKAKPSSNASQPLTETELFQQELEVLVRSKTSLIGLRAPDERPALRLLQERAKALGYGFARWSISAGFEGLITGSAQPDPMAPLEAISSTQKRCICVLCDYHPYIRGDSVQNAPIIRRLKELAWSLAGTKPEAARIVVLVSRELEVPIELKGHIALLEMPYPTVEELRVTVSAAAKASSRATDTEPEAVASVAEAARGLTVQQTNDALSRCLVSTGKLEPGLIVRAKKQVILTEGLLTWEEPAVAGLASVGGLEILKKWLEQRAQAYTERARAFGIAIPKGLLLIGCSGCLHGDTPIHDPVDGTNLSVRDRYMLGTRFHVAARAADGSAVTAAAMPPQMYPVADMIKLTLEDGSSITVTEKHRIWNGKEYLLTSEICELLQGSEPVLLPSNLGNAQPARLPNALHCSDTVPGSPGCYQLDCHSCDERLPASQAGGPASAPSPVGARVSCLGCSHQGVQPVQERVHSQTCQSSAPPSMQDCGRLSLESQLCPASLRTPERAAVTYRAPQRSRAASSYQTGTSQRLACACLQSTPRAGDADGEQQLDDSSQRRLHARGSECLEPPVAPARGGNSFVADRLLASASGPIHKDIQPDRSVLLPSEPSSQLLHARHDDTRYVRVVKAEPAGRHPYYDFHVPIFENYAACGLWHHNCGKSASAKAVSAAWQVPLLRLDGGALFGKYLGDSESNARRAIKVAETVGRCILWIDEIEKSFAGLGSSGDTDGGATARVFGTILTWLQEKTSPVFIIATSNDITKLPAELLRRGRFDEIFFVDLPNSIERKAIWEIHLSKRNRAPADFVTPDLIARSEGMSGAEIEACVIGGLHRAFAEGTELSLCHLLEEIAETVPLAKTAADKINALRRWSVGKARPASLPDPVQELEAGRFSSLEMGNGPSSTAS